MSASPGLLTDLLKSVSRSFYLTLRVLPGPIRPQIGLAYLLARASDTIADTSLLPVSERLAALRAFRDRVLGGAANNKPPAAASAAPDLAAFAAHQGTPAEKTLLDRLPEAERLLETVFEEDRARIHEVLAVIVSGQELDLMRFGESRRGRMVALATAAELDDYTYRVAGCVGEFWTRMCRAHLFPHAPLDDAALLANGIRFGKGLQLVNVLRDLPADVRAGRCYLPENELAGAGLAAEELIAPESFPRLRPVFEAWLDRAEDHLAAGWNYTTQLPRGQMRLRLACAWPLLIGIRTTARLRKTNVLDPSHRVKIPRSDIWKILAQTTLLYPFSSAWEGLFDRARRAQSTAQMSP